MTDIPTPEQVAAMRAMSPPPPPAPTILDGAPRAVRRQAALANRDRDTRKRRKARARIVRLVKRATGKA